MVKEFWITWRRFIVIAVFLMVIFISLMVFLYLKADEITKHPCSVCAEKIGEEVICSPIGSPTSRTFYPNYSVEDKTFGENLDITLGG